MHTSPHSRDDHHWQTAEHLDLISPETVEKSRLSLDKLMKLKEREMRGYVSWDSKSNKLNRNLLVFDITYE